MTAFMLIVGIITIVCACASWVISFEKPTIEELVLLPYCFIPVCNLVVMVYFMWAFLDAEFHVGD